MMPSLYKKRRERKKLLKRKYIRGKGNEFGYLHKTKTDLENINKALYSNKSHLKGREPWKVLPRDSCEIYRERRKRKMEQEFQDDNERDGNSNSSGKDKPKRRYKKRIRRDSSSSFTTTETESNSSQPTD